MTKTTDEQQTTKHQGAGGRNLGDRSLKSDHNQWEQSDPRLEEICTRRTESIQKSTKGNGGGVWNSHRDTQHPFGRRKRVGDGATRFTEGQHRYWGPARDKNHRIHSHATYIGLHGMSDGGRESTPRGDHHRLEGCGGMGG